MFHPTIDFAIICDMCKETKYDEEYSKLHHHCWNCWKIKTVQQKLWKYFEDIEEKWLQIQN